MPRLGLLRLGKSVMLVPVVLALTSCGDSPESHSVGVDVTVDVCSGKHCFTAPVPNAVVVVSGGPSSARAITDQDGQVDLAIDDGDSYTVRAEWNGLVGEMPSVSLGNDDVDVAIRLLPSA